jgi:3-methyladenine DNA glycosylase AlkD
MSVTEKIMLMRDEKYRIFQSRLMPTVDKSKIIGVRTPLLRSLAKSLDEKEAKEFMSKLPHRYYEEDNLHAFLIERIKDFDECVAELDRFLPYVDNWATCDSMTPRILKSDLPLLLFHIDRWIDSGRCYAMRYGIGLMLKFYLEPDTFSAEHLSRAACVHSEEYYVKMMVAWYFATALAKQFEAVVGYIEKYILDRWTHNKSIQKAVESYRVTNKNKEYLKTLRR